MSPNFDINAVDDYLRVMNNHRRLWSDGDTVPFKVYNGACDVAEGLKVEVDRLRAELAQTQAELVSARTELDRLRADIGRAYAVGRRDLTDELLAIQAQYGVPGEVTS